MPDKKLEIPTQIDLQHFISLQAHDLRSPFNQITGFSKMLLNTVSDAPLSDLQKEDLGTVYRSSMRALSLINGLIDIARLNCREKKPTLRAINLEQLVLHAIAQWDKFHPGSNIRTEYHLSNPSAMLQVDEQLTQQAIYGFIGYVAQYCEAKVKVSLIVEEEPGWFVFTFSSTGAKAIQTSEIDLEMLGFTSRAFVELHGGKIRHAVENDKGAIVQFCLPASTKRAPTLL